MICRHPLLPAETSRNIASNLWVDRPFTMAEGVGDFREPAHGLGQAEERD